MVLFCPMMIEVASDQSSFTSDSIHHVIDGDTHAMTDTLIIRIGGKEFTATLFDNPTATALKALLPLTMNMTELNGNEKYFRLSKNLPTSESNPGIIKSGDLMLWGSNTFVLFYETFSTSYSYTRIGKTMNAAGLVAALGTGDITVTVDLKRTKRSQQ